MADWPDATTFAQVWANTVATRPNADFLTFEAPDGKVTNWTYEEFDHIVASMATELVESRRSTWCIGSSCSYKLADLHCRVDRNRSSRRLDRSVRSDGPYRRIR